MIGSYAHLVRSRSLRDVLGNRGSAGLIPWVPRDDVVKSPRSVSSGAMNVENPWWEQEATDISLLASVGGGETGTVWKRPDEYCSMVVPG